MAKYTVSHLCGHDHTHQLTGPQRTREYRLERLAGEDCPDCQSTAWEANRQAKQAADAAVAAKAGLPSLEGSEKQIAWANTIRADLLRSVAQAITQLERSPNQTLVMIAKACKVEDIAAIAALADAVIESGDPGSPEFGAMLTAAVELVNTELSAKWWIDNRGLSVRSLATVAADRKKDLENRRAATLEREAEAELFESIRNRIAAAIPGFGHWKAKIGIWGSNEKRVYFSDNEFSTPLTIYITGDTRNSPGAIETHRQIAAMPSEQIGLLKEILLDLARKYKKITLEGTA